MGRFVVSPLRLDALQPYGFHGLGTSPAAQGRREGFRPTGGLKHG